MKISEQSKDQYGEIQQIKYSNGYVYNGELDPDNNPFWGDILNPEHELIYHGQIIGDILLYFSEYEEKGKINQRPIL